MMRMAALALAAGGLALSVPAAAQTANTGFSSGSVSISTGGTGGSDGHGQWHRTRRGGDDGKRRHRGRRQIGLLGDTWSDDEPNYRHNRTSIDNGYFGHGSAEAGSFAYDRGYPYDYYAGERTAETERTWEAEPPRETRCETEWTHDGDRREKVAVNVCRG